ncbi:MAG: ribosome biogenesis GTPase YlqF [Defluviitaleaceae bacterium]|nr:ribosome biogenesis GTPase YlqF [Defluviitaleaceae bacterium]
MNIQWYPGHMTKTKRMLQSQLGVVDVVIELLDARLPLSSKNPDIDELAANKQRLFVLNKADLADKAITAQWEAYFRRLGFFTLPLDSTQRAAVKPLAERVREIMRPKVERQLERGRVSAPVRAMVVGIPNVGKSTFINQLAGRASAATADRPGVTRGRQWIKVRDMQARGAMDAIDFDLMDTPGVLWPKFDDQQVGIRLAVTGAVNDLILDRITLAEHLIDMLLVINPVSIVARYKVNTDLQGVTKSARQILENIGESRGFKMKGGVVDLERAAITLLDEYRAAKLGRISLEKPTPGGSTPGD